jgi:hypothetical protein
MCWIPIESLRPRVEAEKKEPQLMKKITHTHLVPSALAESELHRCAPACAALSLRSAGQSHRKIKYYAAVDKPHT